MLDSLLVMCIMGTSTIDSKIFNSIHVQPVHMYLVINDLWLCD